MPKKKGERAIVLGNIEGPTYYASCAYDPDCMHRVSFKLDGKNGGDASLEKAVIKWKHMKKLMDQEFISDKMMVAARYKARDHRKKDHPDKEELPCHAKFRAAPGTVEDPKRHRKDMRNAAQNKRRKVARSDVKIVAAEVLKSLQERNEVPPHLVRPFMLCSEACHALT
jgi:hypothetical protein